jgi:WD40 repeat protein
LAFPHPALKQLNTFNHATSPAPSHPQAHFSAVTCLALSPDGWLLLSGGRDKVVVVWDLRNSSKVATIPVYEAVEGVCVRAKGLALGPAYMSSNLTSK